MRAGFELWAAGIGAGLATVVGLTSLGWWMAYDPTTDLVERLPGMDGAPPGSELYLDDVTIGEFAETFAGQPADLPGSWPGFRGDGHDNVVRGGAGLADVWPEEGPEVLWSVELGEGHAGPAVRNGRVYLLDYDEQRRGDALRCFSLADGQEIWRRWYQVKVKRNHGLSRTVPAVTDRFVVTIGPRCHVMAVDALSGELMWGLDLEQDYGTTTPFWYTGQCPIIDDGVAVIAPAGKLLLMGVDCATGDVLWETPNPRGWEMSHVSVVPMELGGTRMYVYSAIGGIVAVSAEDDDRGAVLWETDLWTQSVLAPSPLSLGDDKIFLTAGYGAGSMVIKVTRSGDDFGVEEVAQFMPDAGLASEQQTSVVYRGHVFGIQPKDAGSLREQMVCYDPGDCTKLIWSSGKTHRFGLGPYLIADEKIFVLDDDGTLSLLEASPSRFKKLTSARVLDGPDAWAPMALVGERLLVRDSHRMVCLDVGAGAGEDV